MLIPIGTNVEHRRKPHVTYWLIGLNLLVFAAQWASSRWDGIDSQNEFVRIFAGFEQEGQLSKIHFHIWALVTYQFLHAGWLHIIGNMLFLLPFGKAVEDRMGHVGFAMFYLGCGALGGLTHTLFYANPVIGASGSVCAVVAAFIVLAPKTKIHVLFVFFIIGIYTVPSLLLVGFFVLFDSFNLLTSIFGQNPTPTAWVVHLVGYLAGFIITIGILSMGLIQSSEYDITQMFKQSHRRRVYKKVIESSRTFNKNIEPKLNREQQLSESIGQEVATGQIESAVDNYLLALKEFSSFKVTQRAHYLIGTTLLQTNRIHEGVEIFERYLIQYPNAKDRGEVALLLAAKYTRNLDDFKRASELLKKYKSDFAEQHQDLANTIEGELQ